MRSKALPGWAHTLCTAAAALVFLLAYELIVYRVPVSETSCMAAFSGTASRARPAAATPTSR